MSHFVYDQTSLFYPKTDLTPVPVGADPTKYVAALDWNTGMQACVDLRDALLHGQFFGFTPGSGAAPVGISNYLWMSLDNRLGLHTADPLVPNVFFVPSSFEIRTEGGLGGGGTLDGDHLTLSMYQLIPDPAGSSTTANITVDSYGRVVAHTSGVSSPLLNKGDLYTHNGTAVARQGLGTQGQYLTVDTTTTNGLLWKSLVTTLQGSYDGWGGAGPETIILDTTRKGIMIRKAASGSDDLFGVQSNDGVTSYLLVAGDGSVSMSGAVTAATPTLSTHLTTKAYVDGLITGLNWKAMVRLASTVAGGNVTLSGDQAIDGFTTTELDRVLLKNQTNHVENGIWIAHTGAAWTRAADMPAGSHGATTTVFVDLGTLNEDTSWFCYTEKPTDVVGTDAIDFQVFSNTISMHNALTGLDGGTSGQYYHLTQAEYGTGGTVGLHYIATGGVTFASSTGVLATDASNCFWDNSLKRLGIGTASPDSPLHVVGAAPTSGKGVVNIKTDLGSGDAFSYMLNLQSSAALGESRLNFGDMTFGNAQILGAHVSGGGGYLAIRTLNTADTSFIEALRVTKVQRVGINTNDPNSRLQVVETSGGAETTALSLSNISSSANTAVALCFQPHESGNTGAKIVAVRTATSFRPTDLVFYTCVDPAGLTEKMRITSSGNVILANDLTVTGALGLYSYTAGETLAQYDVVYAYCESGTSGRLKKATNAAESTSRVVGVVVTGNTAGNATTVVMAGVYKMTFTGTAPAITDFGKPVYLSATAGAVTLTAPGAGTVLLRVGYLVGIGTQAEVSIHIGDEFQQ